MIWHLSMCVFSLCLSYRLANSLEAGSVKRVQTSKMAFKCMENINSFLEAAKKFGVPNQELFQTVDLWEKQNLNAVIICLQALGRKVYIHQRTLWLSDPHSFIDQRHMWIGSEIRKTIHRSEGSWEERSPVYRGAVAGRRLGYLFAVWLQQRSQSERIELWQHSPHVGARADQMPIKRTAHLHG